MHFFSRESLLWLAFYNNGVNSLINMVSLFKVNTNIQISNYSQRIFVFIIVATYNIVLDSHEAVMIKTIIKRLFILFCFHLTLTDICNYGYVSVCMWCVHDIFHRYIFHDIYYRRLKSFLKHRHVVIFLKIFTNEN